MAAATMGTNKVFILEKYFNELQKFWDTEKRLHGKRQQSDPCSGVYWVSDVSVGWDCLTMVARVGLCVHPPVRLWFPVRCWQC